MQRKNTLITNPIKKEGYARKSVFFLHEKLIKPRSEKEDLKRREFILNVFLLSSIFLSIFLIITTIPQVFQPSYSGITLQLLFLILFFFSFLLFLSRKGYFILASYIFVFTYIFPVTIAIHEWGADLPQGALTYALIIVMAGILINTRFAFEVTIIVSLILIILTHFQINQITVSKNYWKDDFLEMSDSVEVIVTLFFIAIVSWLSNREIEKSLKRARKSEAALKKEKDLLEEKVEERTEELRKVQFEKFRQLYRFAEFGRLSSGLFHDLSNYLTALFLSLEKIGMSKEDKKKILKDELEHVQIAQKQLEDFMIAVHKQIQSQNSRQLFSIKKEIYQVIKIQNYVALKKNIDIEVIVIDEVITFGNSMRFNQVIANLIANAIDAYDNLSANQKRKKIIRIIIKKHDGKVRLFVCDNGRGISIEIINKIFDPFFTTKGARKGTGIGLSTVKEIVEESFDGEITVQSQINKGTTFCVEFPIRRKNKGK